MNELDGRSILVAGGAGEVGDGIVHALLALGARVLVPSRSPEKLAALAKRVAPTTASRLTTVVADVGSPAGRERIEAVLDPDLFGVVASLGGFWTGPPFTKLDDGTFRSILEGGVFAHAAVARAFLPRLGPGGRFLMINGAAALFPIPSSAPLSVSAAAQLMLTRTLIAEGRGRSGPAVGALVIMQPVATGSVPPTGEHLTKEEVASAAVQFFIGPAEPSVRQISRQAGELRMDRL